MLNRITYGVLIGYYLLATPLSYSLELLQDPQFQQGITVISPHRDQYTGSVVQQGAIFRDETVQHIASPVWRLQQWSNKKSILEGEFNVLTSGSQHWQNAAVIDGKQWVLKSLTKQSNFVDNKTIMEMELNGLAQYSLSDDLLSHHQPQYIQSLEENWPHLLLVQYFDDLRFADYKQLVFSMRARLLFDEKNIREHYNPSTHAGRFVVSFVVQNTLSKNFFWLVLPLYDDRMSISPYGCKKCVAGEACRAIYVLNEPGEWSCPYDGGIWKKNMEKQSSFKMIFRVGSSAFMQNSLGGDSENEIWHTIRLNLLPVLKEAIQAARQQIKSRGFSDGLAFYRITGLSLGWEINGFNHSSLQFSSLSLDGK